jgi:hypothetical protein
MTDHEVEVILTPERIKLYERAMAIGLPAIVVSMYGSKIQKLIDDEHEAVCRIVTGLCISDNNAEEINRAIRARGTNHG